MREEDFSSAIAIANQFGNTAIVSVLEKERKEQKEQEKRLLESRDNRGQEPLQKD